MVAGSFSVFPANLDDWDVYEPESVPVLDSTLQIQVKQRHSWQVLA